MTIMNFRKLFIKMRYYNRYNFNGKKEINGTELKLLVME